MNKNFIFIMCLVFCDAHGCDDYLKCFNDFVQSFFVENNATAVEHVNASVNLSEDFKQVKNIEISEIEKTLREITGFLQDELNRNLQAQSDAVVVKDNPNTKIYVKAFSFNDAGSIFSGLEPRIEETEDAEPLPLFEFINLENTEKGQGVTEDSTTISENNNGITEDESTTQISFELNENQVGEGKEFRKNDLEQKESRNKENSMNEQNNLIKNLVTKESEVKDLNEKEVKYINNLELKHFRDNLIQIDDEYEYSEPNDNDNATDYPTIDYIDMYKDTTNEEIEYIPTEAPKQVEIEEKIEEYHLEVEMDNVTSINGCRGNSSDVSAIYPWIATIYIKNDTANQYQYICDGAILSDKLLITAARCVNFFNATVRPDDVLVFLGKRSLQSAGGGERNVRISQIIIHEEFVNDDVVENDLALLVMAEAVAFTDEIRPACVDIEGTGKTVKSATTAWDLKGDLTPVIFEHIRDCGVNGGSTFCATYGNEVALCPSYGGVFASRRGRSWYLHAIRSGDTADRGPCFTKTVWYTPLGEYMEWIMKFME